MNKQLLSAAVLAAFAVACTRPAPEQPDDITVTSDLANAGTPDLAAAGDLANAGAPDFATAGAGDLANANAPDLAGLAGPDLANSAADLAGVTCSHETDLSFCARLGKSCDQVVGFDNCGASRTTNCGMCAAPRTCGGGGAANVCGCTAESDQVFCAGLGKSCGTASGTDNCGAPRTTTCGGACPCVPESDLSICTRFNESCVPIQAVDNCGTTRQVLCRNGCEPGICPGRSDGTNCATTTLGNDWMNSCFGGICEPARAFCQFDAVSGTWGFQSPGTGGGGADSCGCTSSTHIALRFDDLPGANVDKDCETCVELPGFRAVCF